MIKLITIDIDGTLLNSYGEITDENKEAIQNALDKNIDVVLTSGRMPKAILPIAKEINSTKYLISGNGAAIYDIRNDKMIYSNYMSKKKVLEIIDICEKNSIYYNIYTNDEVLTKSLNYNILYYYHENKKKSEDKKIKINIIKNLREYVEEYDGDDFLKFTICDSDEMVFKGMMKKLKTIKDTEVLEVSHMSKKTIKLGNEDLEVSYYYTEITNKNVNKWSAIEELIKILKIKKDEVMAIGDNINDKEMVENAGTGVVTENGSPLMKEIADKVVSSNNDSGVAEAIEKYID